MARNLVWAEIALEDSQKLESLFGEISTGGGAGDVAVCCPVRPARPRFDVDG